MDCSLPGFPVHHKLPELTQTHIHKVGDAIQPSHPLSPPSPPAFNLSQNQGLFKGFPGGLEVKASASNAGDPGQEDPLEKEMATHSSILAWGILWTEEPGRLQSIGLQESDTTGRLSTNTSCIPLRIK